MSMPHGAVPFPFGDCRICHDKATGVHYGVATCEGCKGFFKRSTTRAEKYKCFFGGSCVLSPQNRNRCKACRYQRCLEVGMSVDSVKMGRIPKVDKERALEAARGVGDGPMPSTSSVSHAAGSNAQDFMRQNSDSRDNPHSGSPNQLLSLEIPPLHHQGLHSHAHGLSPKQENGPYKGSHGSMDMGQNLSGNSHLSPDRPHELSQVSSYRPAHEQQQQQHRPSIDQHRPSIDQHRPSIDQHRPSIEQHRSSLDQHRPSIDQHRPSIEQHRPSLDQHRPSLDQHRPPLDQHRPSLDHDRPSLDHPRPSMYRPPQDQAYRPQNESDAQSLYEVGGEPHQDRARLPSSLPLQHPLHRPFAFQKNTQDETHNADDTFNLERSEKFGPVRPLDLHGAAGHHSDSKSHHHDRMYDKQSSMDWQDSGRGYESFQPKSAYNRSTDFASHGHEFTDSSSVKKERPMPASTFSQPSGTMSPPMDTVAPHFSGRDDSPGGAGYQSKVPVSVSRPSATAAVGHPYWRRNEKLTYRATTQEPGMSDSGISDTNSGSPDHGPWTINRASDLPGMAPPPPISPSSSSQSDSGSRPPSRSLYSPGIIRALLHQVIGSGNDQPVVQQLLSKLAPSPPPPPPPLPPPPAPVQETEVQQKLLVDLLQQLTQSDGGLEGLLIKSLVNSIIKTRQEQEHQPSTTPQEENQFERQQALRNGLDVFDIQPQQHQQKQRQQSDFDHLQQQLQETLAQGHHHHLQQQHQQSPPQQQHKDYEDLQQQHSHSRSPSETIVKTEPQDTSDIVDQQLLQESLKDLTQQIKVEPNPPSPVETAPVQDLDSEEAEEKESSSKGCGERIEQIEATIQRCTELHNKCNTFKIEKIEMMNNEIEGRREHHYLNTISEASFLQVKYIWNSLFETIPIVNNWLLPMAKEFPGFKNLQPEDQGVLMEAAYFDMWLLQSSAFFHNGESYMRLPNGGCYSRWWMRHFLTEKLVQNMFKFTEEFRDCTLTDTEVILVCAIQLTDPDRTGLVDVEKVRTLHNHYLDVLAYEIQRTHQQNHSRVLIDIFRLLPMLGPLNYEQSTVIGSFRIDKPGDGVLKFNPECEDIKGIPDDALAKLREEIAMATDMVAVATNGEASDEAMTSS